MQVGSSIPFNGDLINSNFGHLICERKINQAIVIYLRVKLLSNFSQMKVKLIPYLSMQWLKSYTGMEDFLGRHMPDHEKPPKDRCFLEIFTTA